MPTDLDDVLAHWDVRADRIDPAPRGSNNATRLVTSGRDRYVLRVNDWLDEGQLDAEARLLDRLTASGLPFRVPIPLPGSDGTRQVRAPGGRATLCRFIPGRRPELDSVDAFHRFGVTAGRLGAALAQIPEHALVSDWSAGPLALVAGMGEVGGIAAALGDADATPAQTAPMLGYATTLLTTWATTTGGLPRQLTHGDLAASNLLVDDTDATVAVLDFELSGFQTRVEDLVAALTGSHAIQRPSWTRALLAGWADQHALTHDEAAAIPTLLEAFAFSSLLWRARKWRVGTAIAQDVTTRLEAFLDMRAWVRAHGAELARTAQEFARE